MEPPEDWRRLYEAAPCGLAKLDADFRIVSANAFFHDVIGAAAGHSLAGVRFQSFLSMAGRIFLQTRLQQELALTGRLEELALDIVSLDGSRTPAMLNLIQIFDDSGRPQAIQMAIWRAVAKRAYEAEVPKAREAAAQAARIKADLLANLSHEMRTPLNGVVGVATLLSATALQPEQRQMVEIIRESGDALGRMFSDLLDLSSVKAGKLTLEPRPFELSEVLNGTIASAKLKAEAKGLVWESTCSAAAARRYVGDPIRLKQILDALLSNAVKFTPAGSVRLDVDLDSDARLVLSVSDTGIGFDDSAAAALFEDFAQAEHGFSREFGGAGVGLAITRGLVDLMGGEIVARSQPGAGSLFRVILPLALGRPESEAQAEDLDERPLRILLVEDNPINQRVVQLILAAAEVDLVVAENGALGLEAWRQGIFDLVLMDLQMPVMDGLSAIREIRAAEAGEARRGRTPIVVLSANAMESHRQEAAEAGADTHLAKPVSPESLISCITQTLAGHSSRNGAPRAQSA